MGTVITYLEAPARPADSADPLIETKAGGVRLHAYLPTRMFELVVYSLDVAAAADIAFAPTADALAARVACALGDGADLVRTLTGRASLRAGFSVVG